MRTFGQWDTSGACFPNQVPQITQRRNHLVSAYNAARDKIVEARDVDLANRFNNLKIEIDNFHYQQQLRYPCPWADPSPWGRQYKAFANRLNELRRKATNILVRQKREELRQQEQVDKEKEPTTPEPQPEIPKAKASPAPPKAKPCKPRPCGTPPYNMSCKVPGRGPVPPICKCGKWVCPGGPSAEKIASMKAKGKGGISPYMSQAYGIKKYANPAAKARAKAKAKAEAKAKAKASGLGGLANNRKNLLLLMAVVGVGSYLYFSG